MCYYIPIHDVQRAQQLSTVVNCFGNIFFKERLLLHIGKMFDKTRDLAYKLEQSNAINGDHCVAIEQALDKVERLFGTLSQLGCSDSRAYMNINDMSDQVFLGIPPVTIDKNTFIQIPWRLAPTLRLGKWLHVPMAMMFA